MKKLLFSILALLAFVPFVGVKAQSLLTSLEVEGIGELSLSRNTWNLKLSTSYNYATINAKAADGVKVEGAGKVDIKEGDNTIIVKATSGSETQTYTINLNVTKKDSTSTSASTASSKETSKNDVANPKTGSMMDVMKYGSLIIGAIGVIYLFKNKKAVR